MQGANIVQNLKRWMGFTTVGFLCFAMQARATTADLFYIPPAPHMVRDPNLHNKYYKDELIQAKLDKHPMNVDLLYQQASLYADEERYRESLDVLDEILSLEPQNSKALILMQKIEIILLKIPRNEIGFSQDEYYVSDIKSYWSYSALHYYRFTNYGTFGGRVIQANRYGEAGTQTLLEAYPRINESIHAELLFGLSNTSQRVFPHYQYSLEPYLKLPNNLEMSLGFRGINSFNTNIYTYTGSIGAYLGDFFIWARPYHYTPKSADYYELGMRKYFSDENHLISFKVGAGRTPDIGDLPPFNQIIIYQVKAIAFDGQFSLDKETFLRGRIGCTREILPSGTVRNLINGGAEILYRFA